jgi:hypothetical protein
VIFRPDADRRPQTPDALGAAAYSRRFIDRFASGRAFIASSLLNLYRFSMTAQAIRSPALPAG